MTLYLGLKLDKNDIKGSQQNILKIKHGLEDWCFSPILSSSQAVMRYVSMPTPGEVATPGQQQLTITPYHITKAHNWASRHLEAAIYTTACEPIDIVIADAVAHGTKAQGLQPTFIKRLEGVYLSSLTREISGDGGVMESFTFIFQSCTHTYITLLDGGETKPLGEFSYDLNVRQVGSGDADIMTSEYDPEAE